MRIPRDVMTYSLMAAAVAALVYSLADARSSWHWYGDWLAGLSAAAFVVYGADKLASKAGWRRAPEKLLNALAGLGGCAGAWAGMFLFRHKINHREHRTIWLVLIGSTALHAAILLVLLARGV